MVLLSALYVDFLSLRLVWESRARRPGAFRPGYLRGYVGMGTDKGNIGALPLRGRTLVRARAKIGCSGAADSLFVAIRKCKGHFIVGINIRTDIILADRGTFRGASSARGERYRASGRTIATCDGVPNASKGSGDPRLEGGEGFVQAQSVSRLRGVARTTPSGASCARFLWGSSHILRENYDSGRRGYFYNSVFAIKVVRPKFTQKIPPKELN